jgi:hypothetical protein
MLLKRFTSTLLHLAKKLKHSDFTGENVWNFEHKIDKISYNWTHTYKIVFELNVKIWNSTCDEEEDICVKQVIKYIKLCILIGIVVFANVNFKKLMEQHKLSYTRSVLHVPCCVDYTTWDTHNINCRSVLADKTIKLLAQLDGGWCVFVLSVGLLWYMQFLLGLKP